MADRWNVAKHNQLCYYCLAQGHQGKTCPRSRPCGQDGCTDLHQRLLHKQKETKQKPTLVEETELKRTMDKMSNNGQKDVELLSTDQDTCLAEGKEQTTMVTRNYIRADFIGLHTVPILLKNGGHSLKVNAFLDNASTKSYLNADFAAELGL